MLEKVDAGFEREASEIGVMKCRIFRMAQDRWKKNAAETMNVFERGDVLRFISDYYPALHTYGYDLVLDQVEQMLSGKGIDPSGNAALWCDFRVLLSC